VGSSPVTIARSIDALTEYGNAYGMVFQIVDDILDITATDEQLGKPAGHDMVEGVYTLPVLRTLAWATLPRRVGRSLLGRRSTPVAAGQGARRSCARTTGRSAIETAHEYVERAGRLRRLPRLAGHRSAARLAPARCSTSVSVTA
jgi:heptaprenyl diphosphate synthase